MQHLVSYYLLLQQVVSITLVLGDCKKDEDCVAYSKRLATLPEYSSQISKAGYACMSSKCTYIVTSGNLCRSSADCSQYSFLTHVMAENRTDLFPTGVTFENIQQYLDQICNSDACTIASSCETVSDPFFVNSVPAVSEKCCRGIPQKEPCLQAGALVETCTESSVCLPDENLESNRNICSVPSKKSTQWIGIMLTLLGAGITNLGLNLQKFALRKRHEKVIRKKEEERRGVFYRLTSLKASFSNFSKKFSASSLSLSKIETPNVDHEVPNDTRNTLEDMQSTDENEPKSINTTVVEDPDSPSRRPTLGHVKSITPPDKEKQEFQRKLGFDKLFKNTRWILGILVFTIGNLCNFAAFNFAAQSLLAPLGSVSLIVNVILAPLLNGEIWTWKDILGIIFIISGSTIVVIFAGFPPKDYNLCVLLKLFQQTSTIIFLTVTCLLIAMLFITIVIVERNLDLKENSTVIIEQTLNDGRLIAVTPNPHNGADLPGIIVSDTTEENGRIRRVVTIPGPQTSNENDDEDDEDEDNKIELVDADGIPVKKMFDKTLSDGQSIHSLALTFEISPSEKDLHHNHSKESIMFVAPNISLTKSAGIIVKFVTFTKQWTFFQKLYAIQWIPRFKTPISINSFIVQFGLPIGYASLGGLMGTLTVLFAKATIHLITPTIFEGKNQFTSFQSYLFTLITILTACSQIYWINMGLARYDALIQVPVFFVVWTLFDVVGGGIYYDEFRGFLVHQFILFCFGIVTIFVGVAVLAGRLKRLSDEDKEQGQSV